MLGAPHLFRHETPESKAETRINNYGRSAAEDFGIQTAAGATSLLGIGALGVAANSDGHVPLFTEERAIVRIDLSEA